MDKFEQARSAKTVYFLAEELFPEPFAAEDALTVWCTFFGLQFEYNETTLEYKISKAA
jgi:hypothetical protein